MAGLGADLFYRGPSMVPRSVFFRFPFGLAFLLAAGCAAAPTRVAIDFEPDALAEGARAVTLSLVSSCASVRAGEAPSMPLRTLSFRRGETAMELGAVPPAPFGVHVVARAADCSWVAAGCVDVSSVTSELVVVVRAQTGASCPMCDDGICDMGRLDAGTADGGPTDASFDATIETPDAPADAPPDAPPICMPSCSADSLCTAVGCAPIFGDAMRYGMGGTGLERLHAGATHDYVALRFWDSFTLGATTITDAETSGVDGALVAGPESGGWMTHFVLPSTGQVFRDIEEVGARVWATGRTDGSHVTLVNPGCASSTTTRGSGATFLVSLDAATGCFAGGRLLPQELSSFSAIGTDLVVGGLARSAGDLFGTPVAGTFVARVDPVSETNVWTTPIRSSDVLFVDAIHAGPSIVCATGSFWGEFEGVTPAVSAVGGHFVKCMRLTDGAQTMAIASSRTVRPESIVVDEARGLVFVGGRPGVPMDTIDGIAQVGSFVAAFDLTSGAFRWGHAFGPGHGGSTVELTLSADALYVGAVLEGGTFSPLDVHLGTNGGTAVFRFDPLTGARRWWRLFRGADEFAGYATAVYPPRVPGAPLRIYTNWLGELTHVRDVGSDFTLPLGASSLVLIQYFE